MASRPKNIGAPERFPHAGQQAASPGRSLRALIHLEHHIVVVVALPRMPFQHVQTGNIPESLTICCRVCTVPFNEEIQAEVMPMAAELSCILPLTPR